MLPFCSKGMFKTTRKMTFIYNYPSQLTARLLTMLQLYDMICRKAINNLPDSLFQVGETDENGNGSAFDMVGALPFS